MKTISNIHKPYNQLNYRKPNQQIDIKISGIASYPKLIITSKLIDFGTALFKATNRRKFEVQNIGSAAALVVFECQNKDISIDTSSPNALLVLPNQTKNLTILYIPQIVEKLNVKAFVKSSDNRGETFTIHIKGDVGIPKLTINPLNALSNLNFGVMRLNKPQTKTFTIINDGTIFLAFKCLVDLISVTYIGDHEHAGRPATNVTNPITIVPSEGRLGVGDQVDIEITFLPTLLASHIYEFTLSYEYQQLSSHITGIGGKSAPRMMSPFEEFSFELCRVGRRYQKTIQIWNHGNLGFNYRVVPVQSRLEVPEDFMNLSVLPHITEGIFLAQPTGYCLPNAKIDLNLTYYPNIESSTVQDFLFLYDDTYLPFSVSGLADIPKLHLWDPKKGRVGDEVYVGVHPVNAGFGYVLHLVNTGLFGIDFLMQPLSSTEFEVYPLRGYIEPNSTLPVTVSFRPTSESRFRGRVRVIWEGEAVKTEVVGDGGVGRLEIKFLEERDALLKILDFGMVPFNTYVTI